MGAAVGGGASRRGGRGVCAVWLVLCGGLLLFVLGVFVSVAQARAQTGGVSVSESSLGVTELGGAGAVAVYTVVLDSDPGADVTVAVSSGDRGAVAVDTDPGTDGDQGVLVFTGGASGTWGAAQAVVVRALNDRDDVSEGGVLISHAVSAPGGVYDGMAVAPVRVDVVDAGNGFVVSPVVVEVSEDGAAVGVYTLRFKSRPADRVRIRVSSDPVGVVELGGPAAGDAFGAVLDLSVRRAQWRVPLEVRVRGVDDDVDNPGGERTVVIGHEVTNDGGDRYPTTLSIDSVTVTVVDDDAAAVSVSAPSLSVGEDGGSDTYTVVLDSEPVGDVTVTPASGDPGVVSVSGPLVFSTSDWNSPQPVTVTGVDNDDVAGGAVSVEVSHGVSGGGYDSVAAASVSVEVVDDDAAAVSGVVLVLGVASIDEGGAGSATTLVVRLASPASEEVSVSVAADPASAVRFSAATLTVAAGETDSAAVTVTAVDNDVAGDAQVSVEVSGAVPGGAPFEAPDSVTLRVVDDDAAAVSVSESAVSVGEDGGSDTYTVVLDSEPVGDVTVTPASGDPGVVSVSGPLVFSTSDWSVAQPVTVTGVDNDDVAGGAVSVEVTHGVSGGGYDTVSAASVSVEVVDDDAAAVPRVVLVLGAASIDESGAGAATTLVARLAVPASEAVSVEVAADPASAVRFSATLLTVAAGETDSAAVTVTAVDNDVAGDAQVSVEVSGAVPGGAPFEAPDPVTLGVVDDDVAAVSVSAPSLSVGEAGGTASYTVVLDSEPAGDVTVTPASGDPGVVSVSGPLVFTTSDWSVAQPVTVTAIDNDDVASGAVSVVVSHAVSGGGYGAVSAASVSVEVVDDDTPSVSVSFERGIYIVGEGESVSVTVVLSGTVDGGDGVVVPITQEPFGGASAGDYWGVPAVVVFGPGVVEATFTVSPVVVADAGAGVVLGFGSLPEWLAAAGPDAAWVYFEGGDGGLVGQQQADTYTPYDIEDFNVVWSSPSTDSWGSMPIGNGEIGLNAWVEDGGDLRFFIGKTDSYDENSTILKLGRIRVALDPNPFAAGHTAFEQELDLDEGKIKISAVAPQSDGIDLEVDLEVWVDANHPVIRVEGAANKDVKVTATLEDWRKTRRLLDRTWDLPQQYKDESRDSRGRDRHDLLTLTPDSVYREPDVVVGGLTDRVIWYHRNAYSRWAWINTFQNLGGWNSIGSDPLLHRTFGAAVLGAGMTAKAGTDDRAIEVAATRAIDISVYPHTAHPATVAQWRTGLQQSIDDIAKVAAATRDTDHVEWWKSFWDRHWIKITDTSPTATSKDRQDAFKVAQNHALMRGMLAGNARGFDAIHFNGQIFTVDRPAGRHFQHPFITPGQAGGETAYNQYWRDWDITADLRIWGSAHWFQNTRFGYWPMLMSGDFDMMHSLFDMYIDALPFLQHRVKTYYNHPGAVFPETVLFWGAGIPTDYGKDPYRKNGSGGDLGWTLGPWKRYHFNGNLELSTMMLDYHLMTQDHDWLKTKGLPFIDEIITFFYEHYKQPDGTIRITPTQANEQWHPKGNAMVNSTVHVSGLHAVLDRLLALPEQHTTVADRVFWHKVKAAMPPIPKATKSGLDVIALSESHPSHDHLHENTELYPAFPFRFYGVGRPDFDLITNTWITRSNPEHKGGWVQEPIHATMVGRTEEAKTDLMTYTLVTELFGKLPQGAFRFPVMYGPGHDWLPNVPQASNAMIALQRMLVQYDGARILMFPTWPEYWDVEFKVSAPFDTTIEGVVKDGVLKKFVVEPAERAADVEWFKFAPGSPNVTITAPVDGGIFDWGEDISFAVDVIDTEADGTPVPIDCARVTVRTYLVIDSREHLQTSQNGCTGLVGIADEPSRAATQDLSYKITAEYTDGDSLTGRIPFVVLQPRRQQAEHFTTVARSDRQDLQIRATSDAGGGAHVDGVNQGSHFTFSPINLSGITAIRVRFANHAYDPTSVRGTLEVRAGAVDGPLLATVTGKVTGGTNSNPNWETLPDVSIDTSGLASPASPTELFFVPRNAGTSTHFGKVNWIELVGDGVSTPSAAGSPIVAVTSPVQGGFFGWGEHVDFAVSVIDTDSGGNNVMVDCSKVTVTAYLVIDARATRQGSHADCSGTFKVADEPSLADTKDLFYLITAEYTDSDSLTGRAPPVVLQPKRKQAEHWTTVRRADGRHFSTSPTGDDGVGQHVAGTNQGGYFTFSPINLSGITAVRVRFNNMDGYNPEDTLGTLEVRAGAVDGTLLATVTGQHDPGGWVTLPDAAITNAPAGTTELFFVPKNTGTWTHFGQINWIEFVGAGVSTPTPPVPGVPMVAVRSPLQGGFFGWGEYVNFDVGVTDTDSGGNSVKVDCSQLMVTASLVTTSSGGSVSEAQQTSQTGCSGTLAISSEPANSATADLTYMITATYTDSDSNTVQDSVVLQPKRKQAEHWTAVRKADPRHFSTSATSDAGGGMHVDGVNQGGYFTFSPINLSGITAVKVRFANSEYRPRNILGTLELRAGAVNGPLLATVTGRDNTGGWVTLEAPITNPPSDPIELFFVPRNAGTWSHFGQINWIEFVGAGVSTPTLPVPADSPMVTFTSPLQGGFFGWGENVNFGVGVTDTDSGGNDVTVDCTKVTVTAYLVADGSETQQGSKTGCTGSFAIAAEPSNSATADLTYKITATYTDSDSKTGEASVVLQPKRKQAEHWTAVYRAHPRHFSTSSTSDAGGGLHVAGTNQGGYFTFSPINLSGITAVRVRFNNSDGYRPAATLGTLEVRAGAVNGTLLATLTGRHNPGGWVTLEACITSAPSGPIELFFVPRNAGTWSHFGQINWIEFVSGGVCTPPRPPEPEVTFTSPVQGGFFGWGENVNFVVGVTDGDSGGNDVKVDCTKVTVTAYLVTGTSEAQQTSKTGCTGSFAIAAEPSNSATADLTYKITATYTDSDSKTGEASVVLQPKRKQAEHWTAVHKADSRHFSTSSTSDAGGGQHVDGTNQGGYFTFSPINLSGITAIKVRFANSEYRPANIIGTLEVRAGAVDGPLLTTVTGGITYAPRTAPSWLTLPDAPINAALLADPSAPIELFFVPRNAGQWTHFGQINWIEFVGAGVSTPPPPPVGPPRVTFTAPVDGGIFGWGENVNFDVGVTDTDSGGNNVAIDCTKVTVTAYLVADGSETQQGSKTGCTGSFAIAAEPSNSATADLTYKITATYTDSDSKTGEASVVLQPKRKQAEHWSVMARTDYRHFSTPNTNDAGGGRHVDAVTQGGYFTFSPINLSGITAVKVRFANSSGYRPAATLATLEVRAGAVDGTLLATVTGQHNPGGWVPLPDAAITNAPTGTTELFFVPRNAGQWTHFGQINWIEFVGAGVSTPPSP